MISDINFYHFLYNRLHMNKYTIRIGLGVFVFLAVF